jgi:hypothetical protein
LSREHWKVELLSDEPNWNDAVVWVVVADGCCVIVVSGAVVSAGAWIVHVWLAGDPSWLPAASRARTSNVCEPSARPE